MLAMFFTPALPQRVQRQRAADLLSRLGLSKRLSHRPAHRPAADDARVARAVPVALGDASQGVRYVATSAEYFAAAPCLLKPGMTVVILKP
jgi:hypothetical protein